MEWLLVPVVVLIIVAVIAAYKRGRHDEGVYQDERWQVFFGWREDDKDD